MVGRRQLREQPQVLLMAPIVGPIIASRPLRVLYGVLLAWSIGGAILRRIQLQSDGMERPVARAGHGERPDVLHQGRVSGDRYPPTRLRIRLTRLPRTSHGPRPQRS